VTCEPLDIVVRRPREQQWPRKHRLRERAFWGSTRAHTHRTHTRARARTHAHAHTHTLTRSRLGVVVVAVGRSSARRKYGDVGAYEIMTTSSAHDNEWLAVYADRNFRFTSETVVSNDADGYNQSISFPVSPTDSRSDRGFQAAYVFRPPDERVILFCHYSRVRAEVVMSDRPSEIVSVMTFIIDLLSSLSRVIFVSQLKSFAAYVCRTMARVQRVRGNIKNNCRERDVQRQLQSTATVV